ncbi:hypothetical protein VNO80_35197 [Phaseolus coccineus]|uniref:Uncharacterized protein n=1 Tax=Phaseolus coccineus TaxID=3886 RepID=A0AAN9KV36_PHACN
MTDPASKEEGAFLVISHSLLRPEGDRVPSDMTIGLKTGTSLLAAFLQTRLLGCLGSSRIFFLLRCSQKTWD